MFFISRFNVSEIITHIVGVDIRTRWNGNQGCGLRDKKANTS